MYKTKKMADERFLSKQRRLKKEDLLNLDTLNNI